MIRVLSQRTRSEPDPLHFFRTVGAGVDIGVRTAGDRSRRYQQQVAVVSVVVKEAPFLLAAERHVGVRPDPE
jgi:hypothetical protein